MPKVYAYGCKRPDRETAAAIKGQLWLAHRYRTMLWHLSMAGRSLYREQRRRFVPELVEAEDALAVHLAYLIEERPTPLPDDERLTLRREVQRLRIECKALRDSAKLNAELAAATEEAGERMGVLRRALRNVFSRTFGLYSGTYLHIEAAARSANAGTEDPVKPRWDSSGALAIQLQGGRTAVELMHGNDPSLYIEPPNRSLGKRLGSRTTVHYRLKSDRSGRAVLISLATMLHRDLPADAKVTWAKLIVSKIHEFRYAYSVQLTVESESFANVECGAGVVAVSFRDDALRYASEGEAEQIFEVPNRAAEKIRDFQSIRDTHRNIAIEHLAAWCARQDETADWVRDEIATIEERKSCRRLYHLRNRLRDVVDDATMEYLDKWAYRENHLYTWQSDARVKALRHRKNEYRKFARALRRRFRTLVIDSRKLNEPSRLNWNNRNKGLHEARIVLACAFDDDTIRATGENCEELCEKFRAFETAKTDRGIENTNDEVAKPKREKRTGFARKHREREEEARSAEAARGFST